MLLRLFCKYKQNIFSEKKKKKKKKIIMKKKNKTKKNKKLLSGVPIQYLSGGKSKSTGGGCNAPELAF